MMKRLILVFIATFALSAFVDSLDPIKKAQDFLPDRNIEVIGNEPEPRNIVIKPFHNILERVEEGKRVLAASAPLAMIGGKKEIAVAILDTETGDVFERRFWIKESDIDQANHSKAGPCGRPDHFPEFQPSDGKGDFHIIVNWWNAHNSNLSVIDSICQEDGRYIVVANKILMANARLVYPQDRTGKVYSDIIYSPYSEELHQEEVVKEGLDFLNKKVAESFSEIESLKIQSRAFPGKLVTETISPRFVKSLFINEQSDPKAMISSADGGRKVAERALVRLGLNKETAFRYTYSSVGALGLGQIMPETYRNIAQDYPEAILIKDIGVGRADVSNAIRASILVLDDHFAAVVRRANESSIGKKMLGLKTEEEIEDIRAAIYNGGPGKYQSLTGNISLAIPETVSFLMKLNLIRGLRLFD